MDKLYAILIKGTTLYVTGNIPGDDCRKIELFAKGFESKKTDCKSICQDFVQAVMKKFQIHLIQVPVNFVFRIK